MQIRKNTFKELNAAFFGTAKRPGTNEAQPRTAGTAGNAPSAPAPTNATPAQNA